MRTKRYTRFCGIDVAKRKHVACVINRDDEFVVRSQSFSNDAKGYQGLLNRLKDAGRRTQILVGMEATGHYWYALRDFLVGKGYEVVVLNPIQPKQQARKDIRVRKTDKIEARHIARLLKNSEHKVTIVPGDFAMTCRQLTRLRYKLIGQVARLKQLLWSRLHPVWPEYETLLANPFCKTGRTLLMTAPTPVDVLTLGQQAVTELIRKTSRGKYGPAKAEEIAQAAQQTVGTCRGLDGARISIRSLLTQIEAMTPIRQQLEADIEALADRLPRHIFTLPGINHISAVSLFGETDPIETFDSGAQLVAFAGPDTTVFQTGQYEAPRRRITKRGSPFLRHTLWRMAHRACYQEGDLRDYWLRRRGEGLHHLAAVTATAIKLCHVAWRILTDRRDYLPQSPTTGKSHRRRPTP
ncbi:MAG: IS110 family transposase [Gemmatimonadales bacterium]|nr:IS110 family transposase [Gemmatimonadales bacterium]